MTYMHTQAPAPSFTKRAISVLCALVLSLALAIAPTALAFAAETPFVHDHYGLLSASQRNTLEQTAQQLADKYQVGVYTLIVDDIGNMTARNYATKYFNQYDLGVGPNKGAILLLVAVDSRDYITITHGDSGGSPVIGVAGGIDMFTDVTLDYIESDIVRHLRSNDWTGALNEYYSDCSEAMEYFVAHGEPMNNYYAIDYTNPEQEKNILHLGGTIVSILAALGIPGFVASSKVRREKAAMETAKEATDANTYIKQGSFSLLRKNDDFVRSSTAVVPRATISDSAKGDRDFGGRFGGGFGGGGFSSIGGGFGGGSFGGGRGGKF